MSAAAQQPTGREMCRQLLSRSAHFEIAITIRKSNDAIGVRDVQKLWIIARWIKSDSERFVQIAFCKNFVRIRFAIAVGIAQHLDLVGATLYNEDVAIRSAEQESRIAKTSGVQFNFESRWNFGLCVSWPLQNARAINRESIRARWRQILHRDFAHDARRIACPIAHCGFAGEDRVFFSRRGDYDDDDENSREKDCAQNWIAQSRSFHLLNCSAVKYHADSSCLP
jgi:hypothetical protein